MMMLMLMMMLVSSKDTSGTLMLHCSLPVHEDFLFDVHVDVDVDVDDEAMAGCRTTNDGYDK
jgi:hypothetical protein